MSSRRRRDKTSGQNTSPRDVAQAFSAPWCLPSGCSRPGTFRVPPPASRVDAVRGLPGLPRGLGLVNKKHEQESGGWTERAESLPLRLPACQVSMARPCTSTRGRAAARDPPHSGGAASRACPVYSPCAPNPSLPSCLSPISLMSELVSTSAVPRDGMSFPNDAVSTSGADFTYRHSLFLYAPQHLFSRRATNSEGLATRLACP